MPKYEDLDEDKITLQEFLEEFRDSIDEFEDAVLSESTNIDVDDMFTYTQWLEKVSSFSRD